MSLSCSLLNFFQNFVKDTQQGCRIITFLIYRNDLSKLKCIRNNICKIIAYGFVSREPFWIFISTKWTEWNWWRLCFHFCVCVCVCVCVSVHTQSYWFEWAEWRIVFDSCVKSWEYFRTDNMSLKTSLYWLSEYIVRLKIEVGVEEKCTKMLTPFPMDFPHTPQHVVIIDDVIIVDRRLLRTYIHH